MPENATPYDRPTPDVILDAVESVIGPDFFCWGSQFFINLADNTNLDLNAGNQKRFYPFAQVISGLDVADQLVAGDVMRSVTVREVP